MPSPQILVHISAPSRGSDDARYRQEALGILTFEPATRRELATKKNTQKPIDSGSHEADQIVAPAGENRIERSPAHISVTDRTPRSSLNDAFAAWKTPANLQETRNQFKEPSLASTSPESPVLQVPHLQISRTPATSLLNKNPRHLYSGARHVPSNVRPRTAPSGRSFVQETPVLRHTLSDSFETPPSAVPNSQPTQLSPKRKFNLTSSSPSPTHHGSHSTKRQRKESLPCFDFSQSPADKSAPLIEQRQEQTLQPLRNSPETADDYCAFPGGVQNEQKNFPDAKSFHSSPSEFTNHPRTQAPSDAPLPSSEHSENVYASSRWRREIRPPRETAGFRHFTTHLTPFLKLLRIKCQRVLATIQPCRPLGVLERGHWTFTIPPVGEREWTVELRENMWDFLSEFVGKGRAGTNIWVIFEERSKWAGEDEAVGDCAGNKIASGKEVANVDRGVARIKVYCWGEVVSEIYAMLYLATKRKIHGCGAIWLDSRETAVIRMT